MIGDPPLRTRLSVVTSSLRPATLTQQATLALIQRTAKLLLNPP
jgi:LysR family nitrogen assimilation transcriptional regulator